VGFPYVPLDLYKLCRYALEWWKERTNDEIFIFLVEAEQNFSYAQYYLESVFLMDD